ncbi:hypothetical protein [Pelobacter propionicus]|uniref:hypothetical protein n=1 Tax=Pelobacter propionicus TaxID=29543 RepID=UPI0002E3E95C|nr:hypothetical protein [Pelobacter propionicus]
MASSRAIKIKVALLQMGKKQADIARELNVTSGTVCDVINGRKKSRRVMGYIEELIKSEKSHVEAAHR